MMKRERGVVLALAMALAGGTFGSVSECELPRGSRALWDVKALDKALRTFPVEIPCSNEYGRVAGVEPIFIEGEPLKGKPTRVFAWWGLPKGASAEKKVPAMVLVHGGGGTAFAKWVKLWNDRGYAAIAMDTCGAIPQGERDGKAHPRHAWSGPSGWGSSVAQIGEPLKDQWTYHAVAAVMRCHSYLRSLPEVDRDRIGLTGISWGGYLSSIVGSVDDRFRFAAPVYGCGYYERNPEWLKMDRDKEKLRAWFALWDPKNFYDSPTGGARIPYLWCCGTNDRWYPLDTVRMSCNLLDRSVPLNLSLKCKMPHGHPPAGDPKEIAAYADSFLKDGKPLTDVTSVWMDGNVLRAEFDAHGRTAVKAELLYTCSTNALLMEREWKVVPVADFDARGRLSAPVPADAVMLFANVITDDGLVASSRILQREDWGLVDHPRNPATDWMVGGKGVFAHYLMGEKETFGRIGEFDVPGLVRQLVDMKADWFCLTLGQNTGYMCSPNVTYERTCGYAPGSRCSVRDIPAELIAALKPHGIKLMLYLPCQPPNADAHAETSFGYPAGPERRDRQVNAAAAKRWAAVIEEWSRRYGKGVAGWWFDGAYRWIRFDDEIAALYAAAAKRGNPDAVVAFNEGVKSPVRRWTFAGDYLAGEVNEPFKEACPGRWSDDRQWHLLTFAGSFWGKSDCRYADEQWIAWMKPILEKGGAVTVDLAIDRPTGRLNDAQAAQLKRVFAAVGCEDEVVMTPDGETSSFEAVLGTIRQRRAQGKIPPGRTVKVRLAPGRYHVSGTVELTPADSGIHFTGAGWAASVIDGGVEIGPFAAGADGIWEAKVPEGFSFEQLWVNDRRAVRARTPNEGLFFYMREQDYAEPTGVFYAAPEDLATLKGLSPDDLSRVMVDYWQSWDMGYSAVASIDFKTAKVTTRRNAGRAYFFWDKTCPRYVFENYRGALDAPGEWFLDVKASRLYYMPRPGETPETVRAYAPKVETILRLKGDAGKGEYVKDVRFEGIGFEFSRLAIGPDGIKNSQSAANVKTAAVMAEAADGLVFRNCRIAHAGAHGVWICGGSVRSALEHTLVEDLGAGGVYFGDTQRELKRRELNSSFLRLADSIVRHGGRILNGAVGVWLGQVNDCDVVHNEIADFLYTGVSMGWNWGYMETTTRRNHVDFNHIHHIQQGRLSDGGAFYSLGNQEGSTVCNNWIHDVNGYRDNGSPAWGLYTDEGSAHILLASNLVERCRSGAIHQHYGTENVYANNILATFDEFGVWRSRDEDHVTIRVLNNVFWWKNPDAGTYTGGGKNGPNANLPADGNIYWCAGGAVKSDAFKRETWENWRAGGMDGNGAIADPLFTDPERGDWTLKPDSPALKAGFKPFDWTQAGVLKDDPAWVAKAAERTWDEFRDAAKAPLYFREKAAVDFEKFGVGVIRSTMGSLAPLSDTQGRAGTISVVGADVAQGKRALRFEELPDLPQPFAPMVSLGCRIIDGVARFRFSIRGEKGCNVSIETRDYDSVPKFVNGANLNLRGGCLSASGKKVCEAPLGTWIDVEVALTMEGPKKGEWTCTGTPRGGTPTTVTLQKFANPAFARLTWIGFISYGPVGSAWSLDDIRLWKTPVE